jgi:serine/threonine-protein kinase RsbT
MMSSFAQTSVTGPTDPSSPSSETQTIIAINTTADIVVARQHGRRLSLESGCSGADATLVATLISELARNIVQYAKSGEIVLEKIQSARMHGIRIVCRDAGPGISELQRALVGGYSTSGGLGIGLSGSRKLADEFHLDTGSSGTTVTLTKWLRETAPAQNLMISPPHSGTP